MIVNFFCWRRLEALVVFIALMLATVVHSCTYFDYKIQVLDFAWQILIFVVTLYLYYHKHNCFLALKS